jgi:predicted HAD superfamily Cof-like phosphohydrolase
MGNTNFQDVAAFYEKFGIPKPPDGSIPWPLRDERALERLTLITEEVCELTRAVATHDLVEQADAMVDLVYVVLGMAVELGIPWQRCWDEVQRANMSKVQNVGKRGIKWDVVKPAGWQPPDHSFLLGGTKP